MKHTPEPWEFKDTEMKITGAGDWFGLQVIANVSPKMSFTKGMGTQCANAARIVACVNACAGMDDPQVAINQMAYERDKAKQERNKAENQCEELLEALEMAAAVMTACDAPEVSQKTVREVITKMKKGGV
jgi:hypothetical protein